MKIKSIYIENFGKISNYSMDFYEGYNEVVAGNGYGKSTIATFIRVMFYGFLGEQKRDDFSAERKRFAPWQGGNYGGRISFFVNGKAYELTRFFGKKEKDDFFEVIDTETGLVSGDYSKNIGQDLFGIDGESFMRTIYVTQNDCMTFATGDITAKITNVFEKTSDIDAYDEAMGKLNDLRNKISENRKTGEIYRLKEKVNLLKVKIKECEAFEKEIDDLNVELEKDIKKKEELEATRENLILSIKNSRKEVNNENKGKDVGKNKISGNFKNRVMKLLVVTISIVLVCMSFVAANYCEGKMIPYTLVGIGFFLMVFALFKYGKNNGNDKTVNNGYTYENDNDLNGDMEEKLENIIIEYEAVVEKISFNKAKRESIEEKIKEKNILTEDLSGSENRLLKLKKKAELLDLTVELLEISKNNITARFKEPMLKEFKKYHNVFLEDDMSFMVDADSNVWVMEKGKRRELKFFSAGIKDLVFLCLRMAFADSVFKNEPAFVILDDPFVNLDDDSLDKCKSFIDNISNRYQTIYFTCSNSRSFQ